MRNPFHFFTELLRQPVWIPVWVMALMAVNAASVAFWDEPLARAIFAVFMLSAMLMMGLYAKFGFEKILGMGHVLWVPLLVYAVTAIPAASGAFKTYLAVWSLFTAVSLVFDFADVWKYFAARGADAAK